MYACTTCLFFPGNGTRFSSYSHSSFRLSKLSNLDRNVEILVESRVSFRPISFTRILSNNRLKKKKGKKF